MSSPSARLEARKKALLGRGGDRLAKLATSARGEDAAAFVGEQPCMPPPPPKDTPRRPDPSVWSTEQQQNLMQALMGGALNVPPQSQPSPDPFAHVMAQLAAAQAHGAGGAPGKAPAPPAPPKSPTRLQRWLPLLHLVCMWSLLAVFVLWKEPHVFVEKTAGAVDVAFWRRWPKLATLGTSDGAWGVQIVPFFWAFMTLQVMLHSLRIFSGHDEARPPALLSLALPHLPPPLPSVIMNGLRYVHMGSVFLDDIAAIVFGIGVVIVITSWIVE